MSAAQDLPPAPLPEGRESGTAPESPPAPSSASPQLGAGGTQAFIRAGVLRPGEGIRPTGPAAAAALAAGIAALALGATAPLALAIVRFDQALAEAGRFLLPGGEQLGRFGGQQLVALVAWLGSWALLHLRWRRRQISLTVTALALVGCLVVGLLLAWPPVAQALAALGRPLGV